MPMALLALSKDVSGSNIQRGEKGRRAISFVIMSNTFHIPEAHENPRFR